MNTYDFIFVRVNYPEERGYRMESRRLPPWLHLTITEEGDAKWLTAHSRIHKNKTVRVGPTYGSTFLDTQIIKDLSGEISYRFKI